MSHGARVARNAAWLMAASTAQKAVAFVAFMVVARLLGKEQTGVFFYAVSITSIFVTFADLGMTPVLIRAIAGGQDEGRRMVGAVLRLKVVLVPVAVLGALAYAVLQHPDRTTLLTVAVACAVMTADTFHLALYGVLRGKQNLRPEAVGMFVGQCLTGGMSILVAWLGYGPVALAVALLLGSTWNVVWSVSRVRDVLREVLPPAFADMKRLMWQALPFALAGIAVKVYSYVDSLFIDRLHGHGAVGLYAVAYKLTYAMQFLPLTFSAALYPSLAAAHAAGETEATERTTFGSMRLMAALGFPISAGLSALAPKLIPLIYGPAYAGSIPVLRVLPWVLLPIFLDFPVGALLNATHRAHLKTTAMIVTMVLNVILNAVFVPRLSIVGAAWAGAVSFWALFFIGAWFIRDTVPLRRSLLLTCRATAAAVVGWMAWRLALPYLPLVLTAVFGGLVSLAAAFVFGLVSFAEAVSFLAVVRARFVKSPTPVNHAP